LSIEPQKPQQAHAPETICLARDEASMKSVHPSRATLVVPFSYPPVNRLKKTKKQASFNLSGGIYFLGIQLALGERTKELSPSGLLPCEVRSGDGPPRASAPEAAIKFPVRR
jgi:hypothetical protein